MEPRMGFEPTTTSHPAPQGGTLFPLDGLFVPCSPTPLPVAETLRGMPLRLPGDRLGF